MVPLALVADASQHYAVPSTTYIDKDIRPETVGIAQHIQRCFAPALRVRAWCASSGGA